MKHLNAFFIILMLLASSIGASQALTTSPVHTSSDRITASTPVVKLTMDGTEVSIAEATSYANLPGTPLLPRITKVFTFPLGTRIQSVQFVTSLSTTIALPAPLVLASESTPLDGSLPSSTHEASHGNIQVQCSYRLGAGLQGTQHVLFVLVDFYPCMTLSESKTLTFTPSVQVTISYEPPQQTPKTTGAYDAVIIAPQAYSTALQPLITHKHLMGVEMLLLTVENITASYPGRDVPEKIKYAIKDTIETDGVTSVLLVGGVDVLPIRSCQGMEWMGNVITDLYYADVYDANGSFSSWDANNNNIFGEDADHMDLFPDVRLGRLACASTTEVNTVVDKIIQYETKTYGSDWFKTMIFIGGNTFRWSPGNDGEQLNLIIHNIMTNFTPIYIWTSKGNFNRKTISNTISQGAGFVDYSGHGFENGMGTYTPLGTHMETYLIQYVKDLKNGNKLPIIFFDACLTAKIDYILQDLLNYRIYSPFNLLAKIMHVNTSVRKTCFAWSFLTQQGGGAVATIGATRTAFGGIDDGAGKIAIEFFQCYNTSTYLGEMITGMQEGYIRDVPGDNFTVQEFMLLGDPTLRIGGYPN